MLSILIIEDDITFSLMLKTWLGKKGFVVESASLIQEAKRKIADTKFDLIISDLRLPDDDGIDLLKWLKEKGLSIPLIIMTGYAEIQTAVQAMKLGAADYMKSGQSLKIDVSRSANLLAIPCISKGKVVRLVSCTSMCVWWLQLICLCW